MKKFLSIMAVLLFGITVGYSQAPGIFNYQGVARNSVGNVLKDKSITVRLTIHDGAAAGPTVYQESRGVVTNPFGLFNAQVGSAGATNVTGTIAGVNWSVGAKYIQVEIDPNGGTSFINLGTAQLAAVPYSLFSTLSGDIVLPFSKTQADAGSLFKVTNSGTGAGSTSLEGITNSTAANAAAVKGIVSPTSPGGFSTGLLGQNNGTGGLGIGVTGTQAGSGWGVYGTTPAGIGVYGLSTSGTGVWGQSTSGTGVYGISSTNFGGLFEVTNTASTADALRATTAGTGASWAIRGISSGTNGAGLFQQTNATNTSNNLQSNQAGLGRAGLFNATNAASTANAVDINVAGTGYALRAASTNAAPKALQTVGGVQFTGIGEATNKLLASDATGNATWQNAAALGVVTATSPVLNFIPKFSPSGTNLVNSLLFENGTSLGLGTTTPTHRFDVTHGGSTGIGVNSTSGFSVVDINAASGDAALRFARAGVNQWNTRNRPADDYYEIFELGGGGSRFVIQDGTGNVGIGETAAPSYKLDVLHGGSTGARIRSSSSFSVVDIDAESGDAALRFAKAGVNQWNTRNRPADDYYEIFELGGGGSRFVIQDGTGNVGIGETVAPSYKLDVLHGGSTGIRSRSSGSFSVVDIDAASGDAALRFAKAGVNQWNTRNRPADDYYEIFELGGGGSRFVIQDGTGNVGIGETTAPSYKLDVLHGGSTGARIRSSSSFSVVDIDGESGDAALRFVKAGVNQWNTRNNPGTDDYQIFELGGGGERLRIENTTGRIVTGGDLHVSGTLSKAAGAFKIDHPMDPENKYLVHSFVESPDMMNIYNGNIVTDATGKAIVQLPDYFEALNMEFRYQLTVIGSFSQAIINKEVSNNKFEIATNQPNVKVSWQVTGIRHDAYAQKNRIPNSIEKEATNKGKYLNPEVFNQPKSKTIGYTPEPVESSINDVKVAAKKATPPTTGGSLDQGAIIPPAVKTIDNNGSVSAQTEVKKADVKPVDVKGTSVEDVKKVPVTEKKVVADPGSTKD